MGKWAAIVVAAGKGSRMKSSESKQFLLLGDKPVLVHTLERFSRLARISELVVVVGEHDVQRVSEYKTRFAPALRPDIRVVPGGKERQESVYRGLSALSSDASHVMVHDGVRPFVRDDRVYRCMEKAEETGAAVLAAPVKDTIKQVDRRGIVQSTPDRKSLWAIQTPQAFRLALLREAHERARAEHFSGTDDAMLVERLGYAVHVVEGDGTNLKITTPEDLEWSRWMIERMGKA